MTDAWNGVPENPERDGWHWLRDHEASFCTPVEWRHPGGWVANNIPMLPHEVQTFVIDCCEYLGPCLTPAEVQAREAAVYRAGQEDMRERAAETARCVPIPEDACANEAHGRLSAALHAAIAIRALPIKEVSDD